MTRDEKIAAIQARRAARGNADPVNRLRDHVTGAIERGDAQPVTGMNLDKVWDAFWSAAFEDAQFRENDLACEERREPEDITGRVSPEHAPGYRQAMARVVRRAAPLLATINRHEIPRGKGERSLEDVFGGDLYLTAVGHGAGFWDGDWGDIGDELTQIVDEEMTDLRDGTLFQLQDESWAFQ